MNHSKICIYKQMSDDFLIQNDLKQGDPLSPVLWNMLLGSPGGNEIKWDIPAYGLC
jgi:hypothetical protein